MKGDETLKPDPGTKSDFTAKDNKFAFSPGQVSKLPKPKSLSAFYAWDGLIGLEKGLRTDRRYDLSAYETVLGSYVFFDGANVLSRDGAASKETFCTSCHRWNGIFTS